MRRTNRPTPRLPTQAYVSYEVRAPLGTDHWRQATCAEVDCPRYLQGWLVKVDESTDLGQAQAYYIRHDSTRRHSESRGPDGLTIFSFIAGQNCFRVDEHRIRTGRPELFLRRGGDWRAHTGEQRLFTRPEDWVENFAEHQQRLYVAQQ